MHRLSFMGRAIAEPMQVATMLMSLRNFLEYNGKDELIKTMDSEMLTWTTATTRIIEEQKWMKDRHYLRNEMTSNRCLAHEFTEKVHCGKIWHARNETTKGIWRAIVGVGERETLVVVEILKMNTGMVCTEQFQHGLGLRSRDREIRSVVSRNLQPILMLIVAHPNT